MSSTTTTPHDALATELERLYYIETELCDELETLSVDVSIDALDDGRATDCREQLRETIDDHCDETHHHCERIEGAFEALGEEPATRRVPAFDGLLADKEKFNNVVLNDELRPLYYVELALKLEALECTVYETTMALASALEGDDGDAVIDALQPNYDDERGMRTDLESIADGDAVETLLAASPVDDASRESLDRI
jgi:ferritin-like metal-binding protein YciE